VFKGGKTRFWIVPPRAQNSAMNPAADVQPNE